jgi:Polyketide cyclase / dehydrase and lipid transport
MAKKILLVLAAVLVLFAAFVATRPATYRVSRTIAIAAPPAVVYMEVADFHRWDAWSPWAKLDPSMKTTFAGPVAAPGSSYAWTGNDKVGEGRMTIVDANAGERVGIRLEFIKPFAATSSSEFTFVPSGGATQTTWKMEGRNNFIVKAFTVFNDMDKMIGADFDKGLAQLKSVAEKQARAQPATATSPAAAR